MIAMAFNVAAGLGLITRDESYEAACERESAIWLTAHRPQYDVLAPSNSPQRNACVSPELAARSLTTNRTRHCGTKPTAIYTTKASIGGGEHELDTRLDRLDRTADLDLLPV
jgi:hypothetical protein